MKITAPQLRRIIKEEIKQLRSLSEGRNDPVYGGGLDTAAITDLVLDHIANSGMLPGKNSKNGKPDWAGLHVKIDAEISKLIDKLMSSGDLV